MPTEDDIPTSDTRAPVHRMARIVFRKLKHMVPDNWKDFWFYCFVTFFAQLACAMLAAPSPRLLESAFCREWYQNHDPSKVPLSGEIEEDLCKTTDIQTSFTLSLSILSSLTNLAGASTSFQLHVAIPC